MRDQGADVGFEQSHAQNNDHQAQIKHRRRGGQSEHGVAQRDGGSAPEHRVLRADQAVGDPPAGKTCQIHRRGVQAVDGHCGFIIEPEAAGGDFLHQE